jgi:hypothetical protein
MSLQDIGNFGENDYSEREKAKKSPETSGTVTSYQSKSLSPTKVSI